MTSIGQRAQELSRLNPWWRDPSRWQYSDADLQEVRRANLGYNTRALDDLQEGCLYTLRGPRRVGKTVAVIQCIKQLISNGINPARIIRVAVDGWAEKDLRTLVRVSTIPYLPTSESRFWFIDEITSVKGNWAQQIKWLRDNDPEFRNATVVLTGSNATSLTEAAGFLAGRRGRGKQLDRSLLPMGFRSFATLLSPEIPLDFEGLSLTELHGAQAQRLFRAMIPWLDHVTRLWDLYLLYGGFPRMVSSLKTDGRTDDSFVGDLFDVVSGDAFRNSRLSTIDEIQLLERLWYSMAAPANLSAIAKELDVATDTIKRHTEYLRDAFLLVSCPQKDERRWVPRKGSQTKLYAIDPVIARLPYLLNPIRRDIEPSILSEMQLFNTLRKTIDADKPDLKGDASLFYYRTKNGQEIDLVSEHFGGLAIESKYIDSGNWNSASRIIDGSGWAGIVATRSVLDIETDANTWAVPAGMLAYLLD